MRAGGWLQPLLRSPLQYKCACPASAHAQACQAVPRPDWQRFFGDPCCHTQEHLEQLPPY